ncbi:transcriptional regulator, AsnC family [Segniliparus rotundus DSM 44985]|uniref:Transcriptional regulator, AsnC family n=1 Tax=Segniliparus rotundus (strain ATCC BAA-972 / CDC 1076 / CIP 108378 / DSM 44985 / JCM 13578) TaxID=640132 RepID=D6Z8W3_SEGRD|nr:Lrp/AsnC family transcriptional regulator [Segniliparus rotundus]ADG98393.1 transcriptional regulator, AsnC family [Segniliparus rotundus DSM 44985]
MVFESLPDGAAPASSPEPARIDELDRLLVRELVADGRATLAELAKATGLSVSAVQSRVRRLEAKGVIARYTAAVDHEALGRPLAAFVAITPFDPSAPDTVPALLRGVPGVEACYSVAGEESYVLFVRTSSPRELERLLQQIRATAAVSTRSTIVLQTFYDNAQNV